MALASCLRVATFDSNPRRVGIGKEALIRRLCNRFKLYLQDHLRDRRRETHKFEKGYSSLFMYNK